MPVSAKFAVNSASLLAQPQRRSVRQRRGVTCLAKRNLNGAAAPLAFTAATVLASKAEAAEADGVDSAVSTLVDSIKAAGEVVKQGIELSGAAVEKAKTAYDVAAPYIKQATDVATPVVVEGSKQVQKAVEPAIKALEPQVKDIGKTATEALKSTGVDPSVINSTTKTVTATADSVVTTTKPLLQQFWTFLTTTEPVLLGEYALGAAAVYLLAPIAFGALAGAARGYAGEVTAAAALDQVCNDGNTIIVDIRTTREKETTGIPDLPVRDRLVELDYASIDDRRIRGALRNPAAVEAAITAMQVAALKKLSKGTNVLLLDKNGNNSKSVAKDLNKRGFKNTFIIQGGYEGRGGWTSSKLPIKVATTYTAEVLPPLLGGGTGGRSRTVPIRNSSGMKTQKFSYEPKRKALPSGS